MSKTKLALAAVCTLAPVAVLLVYLGEPDAFQPAPDDGDVVPNPDATPAGALTEEWLGREVKDWQAPYVLARLSSAIYDGKARFIAEAEALGFDGNSVRWITSGHLQAAVVSASAKDGEVTVVVFRGTSSFWEMVDDIDFVGRPLGRWLVHKGFLNALVAVEGGVDREVRARRPNHLWATGHSLGGAMAGVYAAKRLDAGRDVPALVTFGQPAFGDRAMVDDFNDRLGNRYVRVIFEDDPVTRLAPGFDHAGRVVRFRDEEATYQHPAPGSDPFGDGGSTSGHGRYSVERTSPRPFTEGEVRELQRELRTVRIEADETPLDENADAFGAGPAVEQTPVGASMFLHVGDHSMANYLNALAQRQRD